MTKGDQESRLIETWKDDSFDTEYGERLMGLTTDQIRQYEHDGFLCPIDVFDEQSAALLRDQLENLESRVSGCTTREFAVNTNGNWVIPWFDDLVRTPAIVEAVASILGPNIVVLHLDLWIKEPRTKQFIGWHQDLPYMGLNSNTEVTAWLALSTANAKSGCMRFAPGTHRCAVEHITRFSEDSIGSGHEVDVEVDEDNAILAELRPGQISLHHGYMIHSSTKNDSDDRRIGIAIRYGTPDMVAKDESKRLGASLVRGEDHYGNFELVDPPRAEFDADAMESWKSLCLKWQRMAPDLL